MHKYKFEKSFESLQVDNYSYTSEEMNKTLKLINKKLSGEQIIVKSKQRKSKVWIWIGLAAAACVVITILALTMLLNTSQSPEENLAYEAPTPTESEYDVIPLPEYEIPLAYSQRLCSFAVQLDDWVYYANPEDGDKLYKIKEDGTEKTKLSDKCAWNVQVVGDWIYFVYDSAYDNYLQYNYYNSDYDPQKFESGYEEIYKVSVSGSEEICLYKTAEKSLDDISCQITNMIANNNKIYFTESEEIESVEFGRSLVSYIYKLDTNGGNKTLIITADTMIVNFGAVDDYVFYDDVDDITYRIRDDGTGKTRFLDEQFAQFRISDGWMYYVGTSYFDKATGERVDFEKYDNGIYTVYDKASGEEVDIDYLKYMEELRQSANSGELTYKEYSKKSEEFYKKHDILSDLERYTDEKSAFYKIRLDGTEKTKLSDKKFGWSFDIYKDWIYYTNESNSKSLLYKMKTDGSEDQLFSSENKIFLNERISIVGIVEEWIYFERPDSRDYVVLGPDEKQYPLSYKVKIDGTEMQKATLFNAK